MNHAGKTRRKQIKVVKLVIADPRWFYKLFQPDQDGLAGRNKDHQWVGQLINHLE